MSFVRNQDFSYVLKRTAPAYTPCSCSTSSSRSKAPPPPGPGPHTAWRRRRSLPLQAHRARFPEILSHPVQKAQQHLPYLAALRMPGRELRSRLIRLGIVGAATSSASLSRPLHAPDSSLRKETPMNPNKLLVACLTLTVSVGCASLDQPNTSLGPFPTDFKTTIRKHVLRSFFDPYSIRDASISEPVGSRTGEPDGWLVCLETNAKNRMGGYTGLSRTAYYVRLGGQVVGLETGDYGNYSCSGRTLTGTRTLTYSPWPELEQLQHQ